MTTDDPHDSIAPGLDTLVWTGVAGTWIYQYVRALIDMQDKPALNSFFPIHGKSTLDRLVEYERIMPGKSPRYTVSDEVQYLFTTGDKDVITMTDTDRRFAVLDLSDVQVRPGDFAPEKLKRLIRDEHNTHPTRYRKGDK